jgi:3'-5' exoribonuclease
LAEFDTLVAQIDDQPMRALVEACFTGDIRTKLVTMPASVHHHGAAIGGLLAHTLRVARIAMAMVELAPDRIDRDVLLAAALLHDVAKIDAYLPEPGAGESERGRLFGHVLLGLLRVAEALPRIPDLSAEQAQAVLHAIAAAHGRLEYGAPVMPATLEALLLHHADLVEARIESALTAYERMAVGETWTAYLPALGGPLQAPPAQS